MVDAIVGALLDKLLAFLASEGQQLLELDSQFDKLKDELGYMQNFIKEVDRMRRTERREILMKLTKDMRELVYDVEDVISDCHIQFLKQQDGCLLSIASYPQLLNFRFKISKRLKVINQGIEEVKERMNSYLPAAPSTITSRNEESKSRPLSYPILLEEADIVGLEDDASKVEKWIFESQEPSNVIGIVGMGGIGKTTLARKICNKNRVKNSFKHMIFVTISQNFEFEDLLKRMLIKMNVTEISLTKKVEVGDLLEKLQEKLRDEKYLVVLDDVWGNERSWWNSLKSALPKNDGCCVIVTTRNVEVARTMGAIENHIHRPKILSDEDSWSLFSKIAFARTGGECPNSDLEGLGKKIVARCKGLPLAISVMGGTMLGKGDSTNEWRRILEHLKKASLEKKADEQVISSLELSYEELPTYLKPCFLCFSMLPEDYEITVDDIVGWWLGEGFVSELNGGTTFETGREYALELCNRCLLVAEHDMFAKDIVTLKIHDLVRDMAIKIAKEVNFTSLDESGRLKLSAQSRRVGILDNGVIKEVRSTGAKKSKIESKLRTMWGLDIEKEVLLNKNLELGKLKRLRVLNASFRLNEEKFIAKDWLYGIRSLLNLVYLKLDNCAVKKLPDSIGNLSNLQILTLRGCYNLKMLPSTITKLDKLIAFTIIVCESLTSMPEGIGRLSKLEQFVWLPYEDSSQKITSQFGQLKNLGQLRRLEVQLENQNHLEELILNVLSELKHLRVLAISFMAYNDDEVNAFVSSLNHCLSSPLRCLEELFLFDYPGERTPVWLNPTSLPNLKFLRIELGNYLQYMSPQFWEAHWKIEGLSLGYLMELEEEWTMFRTAMPSLRMVRVSRCPKLKSFPLDVTKRDAIWRKEDDNTPGGHY